MRTTIFSFLITFAAAYPQNGGHHICTTNGGELGFCVTRDQCDIDTSSEYGEGIFNPRNLQSDAACPDSLICCKITDQNEPIAENQPKPQNRDQIKKANHPQTNDLNRDHIKPVQADNLQTVSCTIHGGPGQQDEVGECVVPQLCDLGRTIIEDGAGIFDERTLLSSNCSPSTVCCKISSSNEQKVSHNNVKNHSTSSLDQNLAETPLQELENDPQTVSCTIRGGPGQREEVGECVPPQLCGLGRTIIEDGAGIFDERTLLSSNCSPSTVCCKISSSNEQKVSDNNVKNHSTSSLDQNLAKTPRQELENHPQTVSCTIRGGPGQRDEVGECVPPQLCSLGRTIIEDGDGIFDERTLLSSNCSPSTVCCKISSSNEQKISDNNVKNHLTSSLDQNLAKTPRQELENYPRTVSCTIRGGKGQRDEVGECVPPQLCSLGRTIIEDGDGIFDERTLLSSNCSPSTVCCKISSSNEQKVSDNNVKNHSTSSLDQNLAKTPRQELENHPQTESCTIRGGPGQQDEVGECVPPQLCSLGRTIIEDGDGIFDERTLLSSNCSPSTVCCKISSSNEQKVSANNVKKDSTSSRGQNLTKTPLQELENHPQTVTCTIRGGQRDEVGECVPPQLCSQGRTIIEDGAGIFDERTLLSTHCSPSTVCCKISSNNEQEGSANRVSDDNTVNKDSTSRLDQNLSKTPLQKLENHPQTQLSCTTRDGLAGECVQNYLCDRETNFVITDGGDIFDIRLDDDNEDSEGTGCPVPMVCCKVPQIESFDVSSQPPIYPYIRVPRDTSRSGCGWRNPDGVALNGATTPLDPVDPDHAKPGEFPWTVSVMNFRTRVGNTVMFEYVGSGALIHERAVLTAAHIFHDLDTKANPSPFYVTVGDYDQRDGKFLPRKAIGVKDVVIHEGFNAYLANDFALVFLLKTVQVSGHVNFICLPPPGYEEAAGSTCLTSGWGKNGYDVHQYVMNKAELPIVDHTSCESLHRSLKELGPAFALDQSFVCAGESGKDSCKGSGGAPLACPMENEPDRYVLTGLTSWSNNCSLDGRPSVFARVSRVRQWIDDKMAAHTIAKN